MPPRRAALLTPSGLARHPRRSPRPHPTPSRRQSSAAPAAKRRVLSGIQPTGELHIGNYFGALRTWTAHQAEYDNFFCVVDLHALTTPAGHDPAALAAATRQTVATYLACGIDPAQSVVFVQSHVRQHAELQWLLSCATPLGWLTRMTQYKDKAGSGGAAALLGGGTGGGTGGPGEVSVGTGLLTYPVLMAADILLYRAAAVPVGEDQYQHVELTRDIARSFNKRYKKVFRVPAVLPADSAGVRVMSLADGRAKMSKSAPAEGSRINLLDTPEAIAKKVRKAKTDSVAGGVTAEVAVVGGQRYGGSEGGDGAGAERFESESRPEAANLLGLYGLAAGRSCSEVAAELEGCGWGEFKPRLAEALVAALAPVQSEHARLMAEPAHLDGEESPHPQSRPARVQRFQRPNTSRLLATGIIRDGAERAGAVAEQTLSDVKTALGLLAP